MHNRLIFRYRRTRANADPSLLRGCHLRVANRPTVRTQAMRGRRRIGEPRRWLSWGKRVGRGPGKSGPHDPETRRRADSGEVTDSMLPRKASSELVRRPYPKPTQVGR